MLSLNYRDARPIYQQLEEGMRKLILSGAYGADEKLPSVRELAAQLAINPNTIARAYRDLEAEGYLYTVAGKGAFCADCRGAAQTRRQALTSQLQPLVTELRALGMTREDYLALWEGEKTHD